MDQIRIVISDHGAASTAEATIDAKEWEGYRFKLQLGDGGQVSAVEVARDEEALPLNARRLRSVPFTALERACREALRDRNESDAVFGPEEMFVPNERGRGADARLAKIAEAYVETLGEPHQARLLAARTGLAESSIAKNVSLARARHLLTGTTKGSPGGILTPKALGYLEHPGRPVPDSGGRDEAVRHPEPDDLEALRAEVSEIHRTSDELARRIVARLEERDGSRA